MSYSSNPLLPKARADAVRLLVEQKLPMAVAARKSGIHRSTLWRWKQSWLELNDHAQLENSNRPNRAAGSRFRLTSCRWLIPTKSSRPHQFGHCLPQAVVDRIVYWRKVAGAPKDALRIVTVRDAELAVAEAAVQEASFRDFEPEEIARMFDRETGMLRLDYRQGMHTELVRGPSLSEAPRAKKMAKKLTNKGLAVRTAGSYNQRIDDADLASFDVFTHLNRLAAAFDKKDELAALLEAYRPATAES